MLGRELIDTAAQQICSLTGSASTTYTTRTILSEILALRKPTTEIVSHATVFTAALCFHCATYHHLPLPEAASEFNAGLNLTQGHLRSLCSLASDLSVMSAGALRTCRACPRSSSATRSSFPFRKSHGNTMVHRPEILQGYRKVLSLSSSIVRQVPHDLPLWERQAYSLPTTVDIRPLNHSSISHPMPPSM